MSLINHNQLNDVNMIIEDNMKVLWNLGYNV
jgi:hypothetical protein